MRARVLIAALLVATAFISVEGTAQTSEDVSFVFSSQLSKMQEDPSLPIFVYVGRTKYKVPYSVVLDNDVFDSKKRSGKKPTTEEFKEMHKILTNNGYDQVKSQEESGGSKQPLHRGMTEEQKHVYELEHNKKIKEGEL